MNTARRPTTVTQAPPDKPRRSWLRQPVLAMLDMMWRSIMLLWTSVVIGGISISMLVSFATTGTPGVTDPSQWAISQLILSSPATSLVALSCILLITAVSFVGHLLYVADGRSVWSQPVSSAPAPTVEDLRALERTRRVEELTRWARMDTKFWNSARDLWARNRMETLANWLQEDESLWDDLGNVVSQNRPQNWVGRLQMLGGAVSIVTGIFTLTKLVEVVFGL